MKMDFSKYKKDYKYYLLLIIMISIYSLCFFISPYNNPVGDFILDYTLIESVGTNGLTLNALFHTSTFMGEFFNNLLTLFNYKAFNYSFVFIKAINYLLNIGIIILTFILFKPKIINTKNLILFTIFSLLFMDLFGVMQTSSVNYVKLVILFNLLSFICFNKAIEQTGWKQLAYTFLSVQLCSFAFFLPSIIYFLYVLLKKKYHLYVYASALSSFILALSLNHNVLFISNETETFEKAIYALSSALVPIIRVQKTEYINWLFKAGAAAMTIYLIFGTAITIVKKCKEGYLSFIVLIFTILLSIISYDEDSYGYTSIHVLNSYLFAITAYYLFNLHFEKRTHSERIYVFNERIPLLISALLIFISSLFGFESINLNKQLYSNSAEELAYAYYLDAGRIDGDLSIAFEDNKDDIIKKYSYFVKNNLIDVQSFKGLEQNITYIDKNSVRYIRGTNVDSLDERWLQSNFAFELNAQNAFLHIILYAPIENELTLYANNQFVGEYTMEIGKCDINVDLREFYGQNIIINGLFKNEYNGPLDGDGEWSCELMSLYSTNRYGFHDPEGNGVVWSQKIFGEFFPCVETSKIYSLYWPDRSFTNPNYVDITINDTLAYTYELKDGITNVNIDLADYIGQDVYISFNLHKTIVNSVDERELGVIISSFKEYESYKNFEYSYYIDGSSPYLVIEYSDSIDPYQEVELYVNDKQFSKLLLKDFKTANVKLSEYIGKTITFKEHYSIGVEKSCIKSISFKDDYGIYDIDSSGSTWTEKEFGFYFKNSPSLRTFSLYLVDQLNNNNCEVYINNQLIDTINLNSGMNTVALDLYEYYGQEIYIDFKLDKYLDASGDGRVLGGIISNISDLFTNNLEFEYTIDNSNNSPYLTINYQNATGSTQEIELYVNDVFIQKITKDSNKNIVVKTNDFASKDITIKEVYSRPIGSSLIDSITLSDDYGFYGVDSGGSNWTSNEFGFFIKEAPALRTFNAYLVDSLDNNQCDIYINGQYQYSLTLTAGMNSIFVDLYDYFGESVYVDFVLSKYLDSSNDGRILGCIVSNIEDNNDVYKDYEYSYTLDNFNYYQVLEYDYFDNPNQEVDIYINGRYYQTLKSEDDRFVVINTNKYKNEIIIKEHYKYVEKCSYLLGITGKDDYGFYEADTSNSVWTSSEFGFYIKETPAIRTFNAYLIDSLDVNKCDIYVNGLLYDSIVLRSGMNSISVDFSNAIGKEAYVDFVLEKAQGAEVDGRILGLIVSNIKDEFNVYHDFEHVEQITNNGYYQVIEYSNFDNPGQEVDIYINNVFIQTIKATDDRFIVFDTSKYNGSITIKEHYKYMIEKSLFKSISSQNSYGFYEKDETGSRWTSSEFGMCLTNAPTKKKFTMYVTDSQDNCKCYVYVNGVIIDTLVLSSGNNNVTIDLTSYKGQDIDLSFTLEKYIDASKDGRVLGCIISGI